MGDPIEYDMARFEGTDNSQPGTLGVGNVYADFYRCINASPRSVASHVFVLLNNWKEEYYETVSYPYWG